MNPLKLESSNRPGWRQAASSTLLAVAVFLQTTPGTQAATPAPQNLVPDDAWAMITLPSYQSAKGAWDENLYMRLWMDPSMTAFRTHMEETFQSKVLDGFEKETGFKVSELIELIQGQITLAVVPATDPKAEVPFEPLIFLDSEGQSGKLAEVIEQARVKFQEANTPLKPVQINGLTFYTSADEGSASENTVESAGKENQKLLFGQVDSVLLGGVSKAHLERAIQRLKGGGGKSIASQAAFNQIYQKQFRNAEAYGWVQFQAVYKIIEKLALENTPQPGGPGQNANPMAMMMPKPEDVLKALGLDAIQGLGLSWSSSQQGNFVDMVIQANASQRKGLLHLIELERKDASPPPFVTEDVAVFQRARFDASATWNKLEGMLGSISPQLAGFLQMTMSLLGKDRDPNFDFRRNFIENLGDDFIIAQWAPKSTELQDIMNPPELFLVGSPNPEPLVKAFIAASGLLPSGNGVLKERSFLGRTIYSINMPTGAPAPGVDPELMESMGIHFVASGMYVAFTTNVETLETYLRSSRGSGKPLKSNPEFQQAVNAVGGFQSGYIYYQSLAPMVELYYEQLRQDPDAAFDGMLGLLSDTGIPTESDSDDGDRPEVDFGKLPPFEQVKKYFHFNVSGNGSDNSMLRIRSISPIPSSLKR